MSRARAEAAAAVLAALVLAALVPACGKKAPLRLPQDRPVEEAPAPRASVREGRVSLEVRVPRHRLFPEREDPWVLARILREKAGEPGKRVEAGAILETGGFAFGSSLGFADAELPGGSYVYRVEFRDGARRRRALSPPVGVSWDRVPAQPAGLSAAGGPRAIALAWEAPAAGPAVRFALYRREPPSLTETPVTPEPVTGTSHVDVRIEPGTEYCYTVRAVTVVKDVPVEGPAAPEVCARAAAEAPAQAPPSGAAP